MNIEQLEELGFDACYADDDRQTIRVGCSQCRVMIVNGHPFHERGCPNETHECAECDAQIKRGHRLCESCANPEDVIKEPDYDQMTMEEETQILEDIVRGNVSLVLQIGDVYSILKEHYNNEILDIWASRNPDKVKP